MERHNPVFSKDGNEEGVKGDEAFGTLVGSSVKGLTLEGIAHNSRGLAS